MDRLPRVWMFTVGLSVLAVVAALTASAVKKPATDAEAAAQADSCFRYGKFECCYKE